MQALAERLAPLLVGRRLEGYEPLGFTALKTVAPAPESLIDQPVVSVGREGKYLILDFDGPRILVHLSQAGRLDVEEPPKHTRPRGSVVRLKFDGDLAVLVREHGTERKARWWVLAPGDDGPLERLGPEPESDEFAALILEGTDRRRVHTLLRDQRTVSGVGRGFADDALHRAKLSPYASLASLNGDERRTLLDAVRTVMADGLEKERGRTGGLSENKLGGHFVVHGRHGQGCPRCGATMRRVSYEAYEITYCPACQTGGKVLADRRLSRLLK